MSKYTIPRTFLASLTATIFPANLSAQVPASQPASPHQLRFSLVAEEGEAGEIDLYTNPDDGKSLNVYKAAILTEKDLEHVQSNLEYGQLGVSIELTRAGGEIFRQFTSTHLEHRIAIILDGKIVSAAKIHSQIGREVMISMRENATIDDMNRMVESLEKTISHTTTQPAEK